jgi:mono/diheme cytochrome c family protein
MSSYDGIHLRGNTVKVGRLEQVFAAVVAVVCFGLPLHGAKAAMNHRQFAAMKHGAPTSSARSAVARGKYLVTFGSCTDCHTPGSFFGKPDMTRFLGGSDVGFAIPGLGVFVGPNLTPDKKTGLGSWTDEQIVAAFTTGKTPGGRMLAPVMPWHAYANLTKSDALAIVDYLKSLPPVSHQVGGPYGPNQTPAEFVMVVVPPTVYSGLPKPGGAAPAAPAPPSAPPAQPGK